VLYENLVAESALDARYSSKPFPVVALYPREGTFWADHPYAILELPSVAADQREGAEAFRTFLLSAERQRAALSRFGFRPADPGIALGAPLDAAHGLDPAQPKNVLPNPPVEVTRRALEGFESVKRPVSITFVPRLRPRAPDAPSPLRAAVDLADGEDFRAAGIDLAGHAQPAVGPQQSETPTERIQLAPGDSLFDSRETAPDVQIRVSPPSCGASVCRSR
jgi:hypothetical protein